MVDDSLDINSRITCRELSAQSFPFKPVEVLKTKLKLGGQIFYKIFGDAYLSFRRIDYFDGLSCIQLHYIDQRIRVFNKNNVIVVDARRDFNTKNLDALFKTAAFGKSEIEEQQVPTG